ncbi:hypothetical protein V5O48_011026 [Marasmius crinis-equi]|uniref:Transcription factor Iwr1 domain-containing protein n=1 Tax=Marasmius crinis-equi TaxID=585013 RepID=A0ABR3F739_9AGAR
MFGFQPSPVCLTPVANRTLAPLNSYTHNDIYNYRPQNSSPLVGETSPAGPSSSPIQQAQARRRSQYKSKSRTVSSSHGQQSSPSSIGMSLSSETGSILREKFRSTCLERAKDARKKIVKSKRRMEPMSSSDGFDADTSMAMDDENASEDEDDFDDEVLRRVMLNDNRKLKHRYRLSYYASCGDSFDPDLEDPEEWESELQADPDSSSQSEPIEPLSPEELEAAELEAYAEEWERHAALAEFEDIPADRLFGLNDDELDFDTKGKSTVRSNQDFDMEL